MLSIISLLKPLRNFKNRMSGKVNPDEIHIRRTDIQSTSAAIADIVFMCDYFYDKEAYNVRKKLKSYRPGDALKHDSASAPLFQNIARHLKLMDATMDVATSPRSIAGDEELSFEVNPTTGKFEDKVRSTYCVEGQIHKEAP